MSTPTESRGRVLGIGGIFFKSRDHSAVRGWYEANLGIAHGAHGRMFKWRSADDSQTERLTIWSIFPDTSNYFDPSQSRFMLNYIVDDMDAILARLAAGGVRIDSKREDHDYGRFAWIYDPDGNKIELWQPL